jgi:EPS-associated MarR family transcriptional regulator
MIEMNRKGEVWIFAEQEAGHLSDVPLELLSKGRELADQLGMSVGGLNYCLNALIDKGLVKMQNFSNSKNKFKYVYLLTPMGIAEKVALTTRFLSRKMEEYEALKLEIEALRSEVDAPSQDKTQQA